MLNSLAEVSPDSADSTDSEDSEDSTDSAESSSDESLAGPPMTIMASIYDDKKKYSK